ncbi:MAG: hypothetical protein ACFFA3_04465 [Promethearchaeota archaeon]
MKTNKQTSITIVPFIIIGLTISIFVIHPNVFFLHNNEKKEDFISSNNLKISNGPPLSYLAIDRNATTIYRLFEDINITIDTFGYSDVDHSLIQIDFSNGSTVNYNMEQTSIYEYSYVFQPNYNAPLGLQNVSFLIYNATNALLNAHTTYTNFTIKTNYMVLINSSEYKIGDDLYAELTVNNFGSYQFGWNVTIVNSTHESEQGNMIDFVYNAVQFTYHIDNGTFYEIIDRTFYVKLNMTDLITGKTNAAYFPFEVLNSNPNIDTSSISFSPTTVYREEDCTISLNVTDTEVLSRYLNIDMDIEDSQGNFVSTVAIEHTSKNNFTTVFSIPAASPIGKYRINITAEDPSGGSDLVQTFLEVKNNLPKIHSYKINGKSSEQGISIAYGKNIVFSFNVSDVEGVTYIKVALLDENNEWYNITTDYKGLDTEISIRTIDLITGVWYVYIYVIDSDGAVTSLTDDYDKAPQAITIIPDTLSTLLPWLLFIIGILIGILISIGLTFRYYRSKMVDSKTISTKKKDTSSKKKPKSKDLKEEQPTEPPETEIKEELKFEKEEEGAPKRKIKRKL